MKRKNLMATLILTMAGATALFISPRPGAAVANITEASPGQDLLQDLLSADELAEPGQTQFKLGVGGRKFWPREPENVDRNIVLDPSRCNEEGQPGPCRYYKLKLEAGAARLRVALQIVYQESGDVRPWPDFATTGDQMATFTVQMFEPGGVEVAQTCEDPLGAEGAWSAPCQRNTHTVFGHGGWGFELFARNPRAGRWTVRVIPSNVKDLAFRMRAKLEASTAICGKPADTETTARPCLPNLRVVPPYEFTFQTPISGGAVFGPSQGDIALYRGCAPEEIREAQEEALREQLTGTAVPMHSGTAEVPTLCLRYSMGIENIGEGPFYLLGVVTPEANNPDVMSMTERRRYSDGKWKWGAFGAAGKGRLDPGHAHLHYLNGYHFTLHYIADPFWRPGRKSPDADKIVLVGPGQKLGVQPTDEYMADWFRFIHQQQGLELWNESGAGNDPNKDCLARDSTGITCQYWHEARLQAGWGDLYEWNRTGNYAALPPEYQIGPGLGRPGYYVLIGQTDAEGRIEETNEEDNFGYALVQIFSDGSVKLLERGYGQWPWDPRRQVLTESP
jgi:hypothetical protein